MAISWIPCVRALPEDAPVCLPCGSPVKSTEATYPHSPDNLRESVRLVWHGVAGAASAVE